MNLENHFKDNRVILAITLLFSLMVVAIDWPAIEMSVYGRPMIDRTVYIIMLNTYNLPTDFMEVKNVFDFFKYEATWNLLLTFWHRTLNFDINHLFWLIAFFLIWRFSYEVAKGAGPLYILLLFNPLLISLAYSQLRIAFAMLIVSFFWQGRKHLSLTLAAYVLATSIHTATLLFAVMHLAAIYAHRIKLNSMFYLLFAGAFVSIMTGPLRESVLSAVGDRRASYTDMSSSTLYLSFWLFLLVTSLLFWKSILKSIESRYSVCILALVAVNVITGGYSIRFLAIALPALIISFAKYPTRYSGMIILAYILYTLLLWAYWFKV